MKQLFFFLTIIGLQSYCLLTGQITFPETRLFTVTEGLSQSKINAILQDSRGFIWVGTEDGLNRYDGYEFVNYRHEPFETSSLSNNYINAIKEDKNGVLWIATNKGLNCFDVKNSQFKCYSHDPLKSNSLSDNLVLNIFIDSKNCIWVKTLKSLDLFDPKTQTFRKFIHYHDVFHFIAGNIPFPVCEDKKGRLWVGTKDGLNIFDRDLELFKRYISLDYNVNSLSHNEVRAIDVDKKGILWIGTANGLNSFDPEKKEFHRFYPDPNSTQLGNTNRINVLFQDKLGKLLVGTSNGLYYFDKETGTFQTVTMKSSDSFKVSVLSIVEDRSGVLWLGTFKGLIKVGNLKPKFKVYRSSENAPYSFSNDDIGAIYNDGNDIVWIGTWGKGINIFNYKTLHNKVVDFQKKGIDDDNVIHFIYKISPEKFWIGTNNGIIDYDPLKNDYKNLCEENISGCEGLLQNRINTIVKDKNGKYWIGTTHGLFKFDMERRILFPFLNNPDNKKTLCNNTVYCLKPDGIGNIWIGTDNGLDYLNISTEKFTHFESGSTEKFLFSSSTVYCMQFDVKGNLWIGTASGLNRFNPKNKTLKIITIKEGLSDNLIYGIEIDKRENVWVSTNRGINSINTKTFQIRNFDVFDGLQDFEFNFNSASQNEKGELFFGGVSGLNIFSPDSLFDNKIVPPVVMTSIEIITEFGKVEKPNPFSEKIVIPFRSNVFTVNFSALDFTVPTKNNYAYKFYSDNESDWISIGTKHSATFSNLKPGDYTLKIKGSNNDLIWNEKGVSIIISVDSPFWMKTQAYYVYIFILIGFILVIYRYRTFNLLQTNHILKEKEIASIEIERQKEQLAIKNRNITDSINYAKRIQEALMPSEKLFKRILPDSFVLHQPKDIVSGDFFWISERGKKIYVAAVDCTGHGVPGAFMSIIGFELFRKITHNQYIDDPSHILNILNREFEEIFKDVDSVTLKDGMDIAFCVIDKESRVLEFSGAVNPIYLIRENNITEIRGARFSVGLDDLTEEIQTFENKQIVLQEDDVIYLFSDGYADQFGGPEGKKFKYRRFRHLLLTINQYPMEEQQRLLLERINRWKGGYEQVDDILVIGFRPNFRDLIF